MKFDISDIHTIFENKDSKLNENTSSSEYSFNNIPPISKSVFSSMKNTASDPMNLKITMVDSYDEGAQLFIEAIEFATFCEASNLNPGEASEKILNTYKDDVPELNNAEIHVVFPSDSLNKNILGSVNLGRGVSNDWAMKLATGCRRYGLKINTGLKNE